MNIYRYLFQTLVIMFCVLYIFYFLFHLYKVQIQQYNWYQGQEEN